MSARTSKHPGVGAREPAPVSTVAIANHQRARRINLRLLERIAAAVLAELKIKHAGLEINLVGAAEMTRLNETFLRHAGSTDVITFDYSNGECGMWSAARGMHGEIFICVDEALEQARKFKTTWQSEVVRYLVHGTLHLLGHNDLHGGPRRRMKREENRVLHELSRRFALSKL